ncbi:UDP-2,4-diacetamido-2,4,6-trideoxy-beta-L-altropyranose hydrolase [Adhaeribacter rhizoryzae]|uniref:UDP-2,4-diacetamido-2,4, 6-trideoxy-beta-L-altropyranose hydrolase n=1 Tax=Adhaeribacter rhizoryzae TaxID=2607907 RepID=UPI001CC1C307|nr:UDP-2,4-diacetamido-2,4,6-trideoxy-beta-L-altropyranose hydrolase [Adhaeribacter rhizoryzae]
MKQHKRIIFRADGNARIGLGHLTRSLALATMLQEDFTCVFATQEPNPDFLTTLEKAGISVIQLPATLNYEQEAKELVKLVQPFDIIVLDGYVFGTKYQQILKSKENKIVCLDDIHAFPFLADALINQAGGVTPNHYQADINTQFFLGPAYALLRPPFLEAATQTRQISAIKNILLNMGGADPDNQTMHLLQAALINLKEINIQVVVGSAYRYYKQLLEYARQNSNITVYQSLDAEAMCELMQNCDAAILPPSSVAYEWCSVSGLLLVHQIADNQKDLAAFLTQNGLAFPLNQLNQILLHPDQNEIIAQQIKQQRQYFDGKSKLRLKRIFSDLTLGDFLQLRPAEENDMQQLFEWANDPAVRQHSFNPAPIPLEIHQRWFHHKLTDPDCLILIATFENVPAGMIRFDIKENQATISYLLDKNFRGKGFGAWVLTAGVVQLQQLQPDIARVIGHVQQSNIASVVSFQKAGFTKTNIIPPVEPHSLVFAKELN